MRCRRESKRCEFSATRRKRKHSDAVDDDGNEEGVLRRDKRMMVGDPATSNNESSGDTSPYAHAEPTPASFDTEARQKWSEGPSSSTASQRYAPPTNPHPATATAATAAPATGTGQFQDTNTRHSFGPSVYPVGERATAGTGYGLGEGGTPMMNRTAVELLSPAISNSHDALHLLSEAAGRTEDLNRQSLENRYAARQSVPSFNSPMSPLTQEGTPRSTGGSFSRTSRTGAMSMGNYSSGSVDVPLSGARGQPGASGTVQDPGFVDAVKAWSRLRFVRAGWLTVEEAMAYVA